MNLERKLEEHIESLQYILTSVQNLDKEIQKEIEENGSSDKADDEKRLQEKCLRYEEMRLKYNQCIGPSGVGRFLREESYKPHYPVQSGNFFISKHDENMN